MRPSAADARALLFVLLGFAALGWLLPVGAEPPIGDAWSFAWSARQLAEHGELRLTDFQAMSLVGQLWLTWPVALAFSAAPAVLNLVTFGFSAATACLFFLLLRATGASRALAGLAVGVLVADPTYLAESLTYDTEIYFLFAGLAGSLAFARWLASGGAGALWLSGAAFALAVLIRQHAIVFPLAAALALAFRPERRARGLGAPLAALALTPLALAGFYAWLELRHGVPRAYAWQQADLWGRLAEPAGFVAEALRGGLVALHYLSFFLAPLLPVLLVGDAPRRHRLVACGAAALAVAAGTALLWRDGLLMPYLQLGPLRRLFDPLAPWLGGAWLARGLTALTAGLSALLLGELASRALALRPRLAPGGARAATLAFCAAAAGGLLAFTVATGLRFERHLLLPFPFLIAALLGRRAPRPALAAGVLLLAPALLLSLHFVDQRVRAFVCEWDAAQAAVALGYAPFSIDGGFAWNGYHSYERLSRLYGRHVAMPWPPDQHPRAPIRVRSLPFADASHELVETHACANRPGLPAIEFGILRRVD
jgi:hypothetical protein